MAAKKEERRSYQTLEFWLTIVAMLVSTVTYVVGGIVTDPDTSTIMQVLGVIGNILASLGYTAARTSQKESELKYKAAIALADAKKQDPQ